MLGSDLFIVCGTCLVWDVCVCVCRTCVQTRTRATMPCTRVVYIRRNCTISIHWAPILASEKTSVAMLRGVWHKVRRRRARTTTAARQINGTDDYGNGNGDCDGVADDEYGPQRRRTMTTVMATTRTMMTLVVPMGTPMERNTHTEQSNSY